MQNNWNVTPKEAVAIQKTLREQIRLEPLSGAPKLIGGADVSMERFAKEGFAGFVTLTYPDCTLVDHAVVKRDIPFPYIPGLLSFREIPMLVDAWEKLKVKPDVLMVDGIGIAHPRRLGIASHLGLVLDVPTVGVAKNVLIGVYEEPPNVPGEFTYLYDSKYQNEKLGAALRTKLNVKPVFISPGHRITLEESIELVRNTVRGYRLPEPTRFAHNTVNEYRVADKGATAA